MTFSEFEKAFGRFFVGRKEKVSEAFTRLTGRDARASNSEVKRDRPVKNRPAGGGSAEAHSAGS